jgi:hypothetical protein
VTTVRVYIVGISLAFVLAGCVRPWERGALSHRSMEPDQLCEVMVGDFTEHTYDIREGGTGGTGRVGGGCGCN